MEEINSYSDRDEEIVILIERAIVQMIEVQDGVAFTIELHEVAAIWCRANLSPIARKFILY